MDVRVIFSFSIIFTYFIVWYCGGFLLGVYSEFSPFGNVNDVESVLLFNILVQLFAITFCIVFGVVTLNLSLSDFLGGVSYSIKVYLFWFIGFIFVFLFVDLVVNNAYPADLGGHSVLYYGNIFLLFIPVVIIGPLVEEIIFRGFVYWLILRLSGYNVIAVIISSLLFAYFHVEIYDWSALFRVFSAGIFLALCRWHTGGVIMPFVLHGLNNSIELFSLFD